MSNIHNKLLKRYNLTQEQTQIHTNPITQTKPQQQTENIIDPMVLERFQAYNSDEDNCQFNTTHFPHSSIFGQISVPIGIFVKPLGKVEVNQVDLLSGAKSMQKKVDLPRCEKCRAYVNPFFTFLEHGRKMKCNLCQTIDQVPDYYIKELDQNGYVKNFDESPELYSGSVEFLVNDDYTARPPKEPTYIFLIDISKTAYECNIPYYGIHAIKACIQGNRFNGEKNCSIAIGLFDGNLHFVDLKKQKPHIITFTPNMAKQNLYSMEKFLIYLQDFDEEELCQKLDLLYENLNFSIDDVIFEEIAKTVKLTSEIFSFQGGRIFLVVGNKTPYQIKPQDKDKTNRHFFYSNQYDFTKLSADLNKNMMSLDLYCFGHGIQKNLASMAENIRLSGGNLFYYQNASETNLYKFYNELVHSVSKLVTWEAVFRIRCSEGWKKTSYGNYYSSSYNDLLRIQHVDSSYSVMYLFEPIQGKQFQQKDENFFFIQTSLLYTNQFRQRMIRIHNYVLPVNNNVQQIYQSILPQVTLSSIFKKNMANIVSQLSLVDLQIEVINEVKKYLQTTAKYTSDEFQLENFPYISLGFLGILKNIVFQGQYINNFQNDSIDLLTFHRLALNNADYQMIFNNINPSLFDCSDLNQTVYETEDEELNYPPIIRLTIEEAESTKLCLLDDGFSLFLYIIDEEYVQSINLFEEQDYTEEGLSQVQEAQKLRLLVQDLRNQNFQRYLHLYVVLPSEENYFLSIYSKLIEDNGSGFGFTNSYYEFYQTYIRGISRVFQVMLNKSKIKKLITIFPFSIIWYFNIRLWFP